MKIALTVRDFIRGDLLAEFGRQAERLGFASLWVPEHVVMPERIESRYPYATDGQRTIPSTAAMPSPFVTLAYLAAATRTIRLGTAICLAGEHHPLILAKEAATLDCLSGGRMTLGVGIGWLAEEYRALGIPFERRAQRVREYVSVMRKLWGEEVSAFQGEFVSFEAVRSFPKPLNGAQLPVFLGGESEPALKRVAEYGDGWLGWRLRPDEVALKRKRLLELTEAAGRDPRPLEIVISPHQSTANPGELRRYKAMGTDELVISAAHFEQRDQIEQELEKLAREWVEPAAGLE